MKPVYNHRVLPKMVLVLGACACLAMATSALAAAPPKTPLVASTTTLAVLTHDSEAYTQPSRNAKSAAEVNEVRPITGERTILPVVASRTIGGVLWLQVLLPGRPNSHRGWIEAAITTPASTHYQIVVTLSRRQVAVYDNARLLRTFPAVVGKPLTPTPTGQFFVEEVVPLPPSAAGAPSTLALSARSNALPEFEGGPGQVGIHGTDNIIGVVGTAVSHGCVRLQTSDISWLAAHISSGVIVDIVN